jgi:tRNA dimethylallyltransferase
LTCHLSRRSTAKDPDSGAVTASRTRSFAVSAAQDDNVKPIVLLGPTGSGKSSLALQIAEEIGGEIVNYDSVQIYRGSDIGSAKPPAEERARVPHHLFDIVDADEEFNAADYGRLAREVCARIEKPILAGGTFFYLRAFLSGLPEMPGRDETLRARIRHIAAKPRERRGCIAGCRKSIREVVERSPLRPPPRRAGVEVWITSGRPISSWENAEDELPAVKTPARGPRGSCRSRRARRADVPRRA